MKPLSIANAASMVVGLQQVIQRSVESRYDHGPHGVLLVAQGMKCPEIGRMLGDAPRTVEYWERRLEERGLAGLTEGERTGRPSRSTAAQVREVNRVLRAKPRDAGMQVNLWDGQSLAAWIEGEYAIQLGVRQCQRMFRQFGFRLRKPRPLITEANPRCRRRLKKTLETDAGRDRRSLGPGRSTLPATRFALPNVDSAGNERSRCLPSPDPAQRGVLRRGAAPGRELFLPTRIGPVQW
jgi:transposase